MGLDTVLIKVASRCNINCTYCYVYNMGDTGWSRLPPQMSLETARHIVACLQKYLAQAQRPLAVVFHGGEPLLLGAAKLTGVLEIFRHGLPETCSLSLQTNGILLSREILDTCSDFRTSISVSIDGPEGVHDNSRITFTGKGTFDRVLKGIELLRDHPESSFLYSGLLSVVDPASNPQEVYDFLKSVEPPGVDFLYRDGNHSRLPIGKTSFETTEYGEWFVRLFDVYVADSKPMRIRFLDDLMKLTLGGKGSKDGVGLTDFGFLVFETDGSISKNDTLKSAYDGADRFSTGWSARSTRLSVLLEQEEYKYYERQQRPAAKECSFCPDLLVCGGGMTLHRWDDANGFDNPSIYCVDQKLLIAHIRKVLLGAQQSLRPLAVEYAAVHSA